jgi:hypothetical protein
MIRPIRSWFTPVYINTVRSALERGLQSPIFKDGDWGISGLDPDELLDKAIEEIEEAGVPGRFTRELAAMGTFWLCATHIITRASSQRQADPSNGLKDPDWSEPQAIVRKLGESVWGLRVYHRAIIDCRGLVPTEANPSATAARAISTIYAIDENGAALFDPTNAQRKMDPTFVRTEVLAQAPVAEPEVYSSDKKYTQLLAQFNSTVHLLKSTFGALNDVRDSMGRRLIDSQGIIASDAKEYVTTLNDLAMEFAILRRNSEAAARALQEQFESTQREGE